jgi:predicted  nucleic acid-binding Zn-ribbon protein
LSPDAYKVEFDLVESILRDLNTRVKLAVARIEAAARTLLRPSAPGEMRLYHNGAAGASNELDRLRVRLEQLLDLAKEGGQEIRALREAVEGLQWALPRTYAEIIEEAEEIERKDASRQQRLEFTDVSEPDPQPSGRRGRAKA